MKATSAVTQRVKTKKKKKKKKKKTTNGQGQAKQVFFFLGGGVMVEPDFADVTDPSRITKSRVPSESEAKGAIRCSSLAQPTLHTIMLTNLPSNTYR